MLENTFKKFDEVNTTACRWLIYNNNIHKKDLGIDKVKLNNESHLWFIRMMCNYTTFSQNLIFTKNFVIYIYIKYILRVKAIHLKLYHWDDIVFIDGPQFIKEIEDCFSSPNITEKIYHNYYRRNR